MEIMNDTIKRTPLLSISIPTWNRAKYLAISLESFLEEMKGINPEEIELCVSDNCSDDNTSEVVKKYIDKGLPISYYKNEENIGASRNFLRCMQRATGKYIFLLGDDDILNPGSLSLILNSLRDKSYGIVHIHKYANVSEEFKEYTDLESFYKQISFWFTFVSGSIFRKEVVEMIDSERYIDTRLLQLPYFIKSAQLSSQNLLINKPVLKEGLDDRSNGGYNFYEVFVRNYLRIWYELVENNIISKDCFNFIKKDIYLNFIDKSFNYRLLVKHQGVKEEDKSKGFSRKGFMIDGAKDILQEYYGGNYYYYWSMVRMYSRKYVARVYHLFK